ncbi:CHAT domain-containing protein [Leptothoe sp. LEGE 181152]|nr:CHAT domain-containing protein [Leptothoe sp. LEGE 181152]
MKEAQLIKVLFLSSEPTDTARLRLGQELRDIRAKIQMAKQRDYLVLESREATRPGDITQAIFDVDPQIIHFSGHGTSAGELCFENSVGTSQPVQAEALATLFQLVSEQINCVLLNACYSEIQAEAIAQYIPYVIGMNQVIGDQAAITFATGFYKALGANRTIEQAYKFGCIEIQLEGIPEHLTPVLKTKGDHQKETSIQKLEKETGIQQKKFVLVLSATIDEIDKPIAEAIVEHLKKVSGDYSITLNEIAVGSVRLLLEGSEQGIRILETLFLSGELNELLGFLVTDIINPRDQEKDIKALTERALGSLLYRYPYLYFSCLKRKDQNILAAENDILALRQKAQINFEQSLKTYINQKYIQHLPSDAFRRSQENPTLLYDIELNRALNYFSPNRLDSLKDSAQRLLISWETEGIRINKFTEDIINFLLTDLKGYRNSFLRRKLEPIFSDIDIQNSALTRTTKTLIFSRVLDCLVCGQRSETANLNSFFILLKRIGSLEFIRILLKIVLLSKINRPTLESRFSIIFESYSNEICSNIIWLVDALEYLNVALSINFPTKNSL